MDVLCLPESKEKTRRNLVLSKIRELCSLDKRSLALFRVLIALTTLFDLADRARDLSAHYTDDGFFSREMVLQKYWNRYWFSLHMASGSWAWEAMLFLVAAAIACLLLVGYKTRVICLTPFRTMTFLTWAFVLSIQCRNVIVGHGGDVLHRLMLFFAIFLPLGDVWSVDSALKKKQKWREDYLVSNICSMAFMCQILLMYVCAFNHKTAKEWRTEGTSAWLALQLDFFRRDYFGDLLLYFPTFLKYSTFGVLYWQGFGSLFFFSPVYTGPMRAFGCLGYFTMHACFAAAFRLGQFAWVTCSVVPALLPAWFWDDLIFKYILPRDKKMSHFKIYYINSCKFCENFVWLFKTFFLFKDVEIVPVQHLQTEEEPCQCGNHCNWGDDDESKVHSHQRLHKASGWITTVEQNGKVKGGFDAIVSLCEASPVLKYASPILKNTSVKNFGKKLLAISHSHASANDREQDIESPPSPSTMRASYHMNESKSKKKRNIKEKTDFQLFLKIFVIIIANVFAGFCFYLGLSWNAEVLHYPQYLTPSPLRPVVWALHLDQSWAMFSPRPPDSWWWYNIEAELDNGTKAELFANGALFTKVPNQFSWDKPKPFYLGFKNHRWFKYWENGYNMREDLRLDFGRWLCREWNGVHNGGSRLYKFNVHWMSERNDPKFDGSRIFQGHQTLWSHMCYEKR